MRWATLATLATGGIPAILGAQGGARGGPPVPQETGQFSSSGTVVWLRVADDGSVLVFAARGFRSAFAHPSVLTAAETARWAALFTAFLAVDSVAQADRDASGPRGTDTAALHGVFADGDVTLQQQTVGQAVALVMHYGARGPAPVTASYPALALHTIIPTLQRTAQLAKAVAAAHQAAIAAVAAPPAAPTTASPVSIAPAAAAPTNDHPDASTTPSPASTGTPTTPAAPSTPPIVAAPKAAPGRSASTAVAAAPLRLSTTASTAAGPAQTPPASVVVPVALPISPPPTSQEVGKKRLATSASPPAPPTPRTASRAPSSLGGSASPQIGYVVDPPNSQIEYSAAPVVASAGTGHASQSSPSSGQSGGSASAGTGGAAATATTKSPSGDGKSGDGKSGVESAAGDSVAEKALNSEGRLSPAVLGDVIRQRQQLLQYCYTEFGLRGDAALAGQIVVRLVIQQDGTVSEVTVPQHHWSGHGADKVESCIRDRVLLWEFPAAQRASTHEIQLIFGR